MSRFPCCAVVATMACSAPAPPTTIAKPAPPRAGSQQPAEIISCIDLPRGDPRSHNLSGLTWDPASHLLYAISDRDPQLTVLAPRPGFTEVDLAPPIALDIAIQHWDGEAVTLAGDRFLVVANETDAAVYSVDRTGHGATRLALPPFPGIRDNLGLESLSYVASATGRYVITANEEALDGDGPVSSLEHGTVVRILRHPLDGGPDFEAAYLTDPVFADGSPSDNGVSDLAALTPDRLLLIERGWVNAKGNSTRIYEVDLRGARDAIGAADARTVTPVAKRLIVDLAGLADQRCPRPPSLQRSRTLDNYEGLAIGPTLDDGRQLIFLITDDNLRDNQVPRLLTLALGPGAW